MFWVRGVWRYQKGNQNPYIEEEQKTQWPNEQVQKDKQRSTKHGTWNQRLSNTNFTKIPGVISGAPEWLAVHLWHKYSITVNQVMVVNFRCWSQKFYLMRACIYTLWNQCNISSHDLFLSTCMQFNRAKTE